jgi:hypothetical protein
MAGEAARRRVLVAAMMRLRLVFMALRACRGGRRIEGAVQSNWLWLVPVEFARASYSPIVFLIVIVCVTLLTLILVRRFYHGRVRYSEAWGCGYSELTARTQDTADAFGQPIRHVFGPLYLMKRLAGADDAAPRFSLKIEDRHWYWLYLPVAHWRIRFVKIALLQQADQHLPAYSFSP